MTIKIIYKFLLIFLGNFLIFQFAYKDVLFSKIAIIGGLIIFYSILSLILFLTDQLDMSKISNDLFISTLLIGFLILHILFYLKYNNNQIQTLEKNGKIVKQ